MKKAQYAKATYVGKSAKADNQHVFYVESTFQGGAVAVTKTEEDLKGMWDLRDGGSLSYEDYCITCIFEGDEFYQAMVPIEEYSTLVDKAYEMDC